MLSDKLISEKEIYKEIYYEIIMNLEPGRE